MGRSRFVSQWLARGVSVMMVLFAPVLAQASPATPPPGTTERLNVAAAGDAHTVDISADGRYMAFESTSDIIVPNDANTHADIFVSDLVSKTVQRVSVTNTSSDEATGGDSVKPGISADGKVVAFISQAVNLTSDAYTHANQWNVFVRVISTSQTIRINGLLGSEPDASADTDFNVSVSGDGNWVAFGSSASNLSSPSPANTSRVHAYVWGPLSGAPTVSMLDVTPSNTVCSTQPAYNFLTKASLSPHLSFDGHYAAFASVCDDLMSPLTPQGYKNIYRRNLVSGVTELLTRDTAGSPLAFPVSGIPHGISPDGCFVSFDAMSTELVPTDTSSYQEAFLWDCTVVGITNKLERISVAGPSIELNGDSIAGSVSSNGRYVTFTSDSTNAIAGDTNNATDIFFRDRVNHTTTRLSISTSAAQLSKGVATAYHAMTPDARYIAFIANSPELNVNSLGAFRHDRTGGATVLGSAPYKPPETSKFSASVQPSLSQNGRYVVFASNATNLTSANNGLATQIYMRDLLNGVNTLQSYSGIGNDYSDGNSETPVISSAAPGCRVAYTSYGTTMIISGTNGISVTNGVKNIFTKGCAITDLPFQTYRLSAQTTYTGYQYEATADSSNPSINRAGTAVAFESADSRLVDDDAVTTAGSQIYIASIARMTQQATLLFRASGYLYRSDGDNNHPRLAGDANCVVWDANANNNTPFQTPESHRGIYLAAYDLDAMAALSPTLLSNRHNFEAVYPGVSADCRFVAWIQWSPSTPLTQTLEIVDRAANTQHTLDTATQFYGAPSISDDGRFVTYCAQDASSVYSAVYSYDRAFHTRYLVSRDLSSALADGATCQNDLLGPTTDQTGRFVAYSSYNSNLVVSDTNQAFDVFGTSILAATVPTITWAITQVTAHVGGGVIPLVIQRNGPASITSTVHLHVGYSEALAGPEYNVVGEHTDITFLPGQSITTTPLIMGNTVISNGAHEKVQLLLFEPGQAVLGDPNLLTVTIIDQIQVYLPRLLR